MVTNKTAMIFPTSVEEAFNHLVYAKDCQHWMDEDDLNGLLYLINGTDFCGIEVSNPTDGLAPIKMPLRRLEKNRSVTFGPSIPNQENVESSVINAFPFKEMYMTMEFAKHSDGCEVHFSVSLAPSGLLGWVLCKLAVAPYALRNMKQKNQALVRYLDSAGQL